MSSHRPRKNQQSYGSSVGSSVSSGKPARPARHRAPGRPRSTVAAVATTTVLCAGVVVTGSAATAHVSRLHPTAAASGQPPAAGPVPVSIAADGMVARHGLIPLPVSIAADGMVARHGLIPLPAAQRASRASARPALPAFVRPGTGVLTSCFCWRWGAFHDGIDLAAPLGAPIYAASAGVVTKAGPDRGYGNLINIKHPGGTETFYGHEEKVLVKVGQHVRAGQLIALVGNLGYSTGPHLHFGVRVHGAGVDPVAWLHSHAVKV